MTNEKKGGIIEEEFYGGLQMRDIAKNIEAVRRDFANGNLFGEKVMLVAATKTQSVEAINVAIQAGVDAVAENRVQ